MQKLSFLIAAHNEEKIIRKPLEALQKLPYANFEVLIGLDGCSDGTDSIVSEFVQSDSRFKSIRLNLRQGKPAVIDALVPLCEGEIIIIHDADWIFSYSSKEKLDAFLSVFSRQDIGGIAESYPVEWGVEGNFWFRLVGISHYYWMRQLKSRLRSRENLLEILEAQMFLTNIFRKSLYQTSSTLGDDFERTQHILASGKKVVIFDDPTYPRMIAGYRNITLKDLLRQKKRTALARKQIRRMPGDSGTRNGNLVLKMIARAFSHSFKHGTYIILWSLIMIKSELQALFAHVDTRKGWTLRAER